MPTCGWCNDASANCGMAMLVCSVTFVAAAVVVFRFSLHGARPEGTELERSEHARDGAVSPDLISTSPPSGRKTAPRQDLQLRPIPWTRYDDARSAVWIPCCCCCCSCSCCCARTAVWHGHACHGHHRWNGSGNNSSSSDRLCKQTATEHSSHQCCCCGRGCRCQ